MKELDRLESAGYMVSWCQRLSARLIERELQPLRITPAYLPVFFALADGRSMSPSALAKAAAIEHATMTVTLSRMERDGFIRRRPNQNDGRSTLISLSPVAMANAAEVNEITKSLNKQMLAVLSKEDRVVFMKALRAVISELIELNDT